MKKTWLVTCGVAAVMLILLVCGWASLFGRGKDSNIVSFRPVAFTVHTEQPFFYSINNKLHFGRTLSDSLPVLFTGVIRNYLVSPDKTMLALVGSGKLIIVTQQGQVREIGPTDDIFREHKPFGRSFIRDFRFQWSKDSTKLYYTRDTYYRSKGAQLFSSKEELWRFDITTYKSELILKPFPADEYFFGQIEGDIYFSAATPEGNLILRRFDGKQVSDVQSVNSWTIPLNGLRSGAEDQPFFSFSSLDFRNLYYGFASLEVNPKSKEATLVANGHDFFVMTQGEGFKGTYYCVDPYQGFTLPEGKYAIGNAYCGNYRGSMVFDLSDGSYAPISGEVKAFQTYNTDEITSYRVSSGGILLQ